MAFTRIGEQEILTELAVLWTDHDSLSVSDAAACCTGAMHLYPAAALPDSTRKEEGALENSWGCCLSLSVMADLVYQIILCK